jgi:hypothetical protein
MDTALSNPSRATQQKFATGSQRVGNAYTSIVYFNLADIDFAVGLRKNKSPANC